MKVNAELRLDVSVSCTRVNTAGQQHRVQSCRDLVVLVPRSAAVHLYTWRKCVCDAQCARFRSCSRHGSNGSVCYRVPRSAAEGDFLISGSATHFYM